MKGKPDLRVPSLEGRENYGKITRACGCPLGSECDHVVRRCIYSKFNSISLSWRCNCKQKNRECIFI